MKGIAIGMIVGAILGGLVGWIFFRKDSPIKTAHPSIGLVLIPEERVVQPGDSFLVFSAAIGGDSTWWWEELSASADPLINPRVIFANREYTATRFQTAGLDTTVEHPIHFKLGWVKGPESMALKREIRLIPRRFDGTTYWVIDEPERPWLTPLSLEPSD